MRLNFPCKIVALLALVSTLTISVLPSSSPRIYTCVEVSRAFLDGGWGQALMLDSDRYVMLDYSLKEGEREVLQLLSKSKTV